MMTDTAFGGRLFGPGLPGAGVPAVGRWIDDGSFVVSGPGEGDDGFVAGSPKIDAGGFNAAGIRISWRSQGGDFVFFVDQSACRACSMSAPPHIASQLWAAASVSSRLQRRLRLGGALALILLILLLAGLGALLLQSDRAADWAIGFIPPQREAKLGDLFLAQLRLRMKLHETGPAAGGLGAIGGKLTAGSPYRYRFLIADDPQVNAFAVPGGVVVVHRGLLKAAGSSGEVAGVLAHEIAHVELRHSLRMMVQSLGLRAVFSVMLGDLSGGALSEGAARLAELRYSRDAEREADREGVRRMVAARVDPEGMLRFFQRLEREKRPEIPLILSTHPPTSERLAALRREVSARTGSWEPLSVGIESLR